jgi:hypothetical protein
MHRRRQKHRCSDVAGGGILDWSPFIASVFSVAVQRLRMEADPRADRDDADSSGGSSDATDSRGVTSDGSADVGGDSAAKPRYAPPDRETFDWRGWLLVAVVFVCFLAVPGVILYLPQAKPLIESLGLTLRDAYLALPMVPALVLGAVAVWSAVASRRSE